MTSTTPRASSTPSRRLGAVALVGLTALGLTACGSDPEPESVGAPIVLSSSGTDPGTTSPTAEPTASASAPASSPATGGAAPVAAVVRDDRASGSSTSAW